MPMNAPYDGSEHDMVAWRTGTAWTLWHLRRILPTPEPKTLCGVEVPARATMRSEPARLPDICRTCFTALARKES